MSVGAITFVGGGNMGTALVEGLIRSGESPSAITIVESSADRRAVLAQTFPGVTLTEKIGPCTAGVVAVKPAGAADVCRELGRAGATRVLSIAAGVSVETLQNAAGSSTAVVRAMPNTPALVGEGAAGMCASSQCSLADLEWAKAVLGAVGVVVEVPESLIDAVTAISGSGPAYLFLVAEAMIDAGVAQGLPRDIADALVRQLLVGSGRLLQQTGEAPEALRAKVTSPNGVTAAAIEALERAGLRSAITQTVEAAVRRSREMGN
ncbi:MAG: pyrroline-5-carboxylate reductase [Ilumatobacteraceae bacterium]